MTVTYRPSLDEVRTLATQGNLIPVYREIVADLETPVSAYLKIAEGNDYAFLLESVEGGERLARYSFLGTAPYRIIQTGSPDAGPRSYTDPLRLIEDEIRDLRPVAVPGLPRFSGGAVGYLGYECVRYFERLPSPEKDVLGVPESIFMLTDTLVVFDHVRHRIKVVSHVHTEGDIERAYQAACTRIDKLVERLRGPLPALPPAKEPLPLPERQLRSNFTRDEYIHVVETCKAYIRAGDIIQVVPSQRLERRTNADPFTIYRALRAINPSPYMFFLKLDGLHIVGASPELMCRVEDGDIAVHPIAGTRPRGRTEEEDRELEADLLNDEKEQAEHVMLVDLGRNDVGRVAQIGSVDVTQFMETERYSHVIHIVSNVTGKLREDLTAFDAIRSTFPAGTVSGAPKIRAMEIIAEVEPSRRGIYSGAVGYIGFGGNTDTAIALRTMVLKDGVAYVQAGGGVVADSVGETEYQETMNKAMALLKAIDEAEEGLELE